MSSLPIQPVQRISRHRPLSTSAVTVHPLSEAPLPLLIQPQLKGIDLASWITTNRSQVKTQLLEWGAILFRRFPMTCVAQFQGVIAALCEEALEYRYRASPRSQVADRIYTSTDYPADQPIFPHNEHAYSSTLPTKIFFCCLCPAPLGGETPIGSTRRIQRRIDPQIRDRLIERQILYVRNFGDGFGLPWQTVFQSDDPAVVDAYCQQHGIETQWKSHRRLRTRQRGPAVIAHPETGELVWCNHATFFHSSSLPSAIREPLLATFAEEDLPTQTFYGDGEPFEPDVIAHLQTAYRQEMIQFDWHAGDILLLDNLLAVHGRNPFTGPRQVLVGMAEAYSPPMHSCSTSLGDPS